MSTLHIGRCSVFAHSRFHVICSCSFPPPLLNTSDNNNQEVRWGLRGSSSLAAEINAFKLNVEAPHATRAVSASKLCC